MLSFFDNMVFFRRKEILNYTSVILRKEFGFECKQEHDKISFSNLCVYIYLLILMLDGLIFLFL